MAEENPRKPQIGDRSVKSSPQTGCLNPNDFSLIVKHARNGEGTKEGKDGEVAMNINSNSFVTYYCYIVGPTVINSLIKNTSFMMFEVESWNMKQRFSKPILRVH